MAQEKFTPGQELAITGPDLKRYGIPPYRFVKVNEVMTDLIIFTDGRGIERRALVKNITAKTKTQETFKK